MTNKELGIRFLTDFKVVGDGIVDDTANLQNAIDFCSENNLELRNDIRNGVIKTTSPIYLYDWHDIDLSGVEILKATNTLGVGSNKQRSNTYITSYEVDAIFIVCHADNEYSSNIKLKNIAFNSSASTKNSYAIYAPFLVDCEFEDLMFANCDYGLYGYCWYLIPTIKNLKANKFKAVVALVDDGTHIGSSTSLNMKQIYGTQCENVVKLFGASYSKIDIPCGDFCTSYMMHFTSCKEITIDSPSTEHAINGNFAYISNSSILINSPNAFRQGANSPMETYMFFIDWHSRVIINNGTFEDFIGNYASSVHKFVIKDGTHVQLNNTKLPNNGNNYQALTNGSSITTNDSNGRTFSQINGDYLLVDKTGGKKITKSDKPPTNGQWSVGDICYNSNLMSGSFYLWQCVRDGEPGTWTGFGKIEN